MEKSARHGAGIGNEGRGVRRGRAGFEALLHARAKSADMPLDRETIFQILVSAGAVALFIGAAIVVTQTYSVDGHITGQGGIAMVGAIVVFILAMGGAGLWLERQDFDGDGA
jgi:hypothetical protein